eukprot:scaffold316_cov352-Pavlova_lutheri.AAC.31
MAARALHALMGVVVAWTVLVEASPNVDRDHCTAMGVGKSATVRGGTMVSHTDDSGDATSDLRLVRVPAKDHEPGAMRPVYHILDGYPRLVDAERSPYYAPVNGQKPSTPLGYIPEVEHTYAYWEQDYALQNEHGLAMGESTCGSNAQQASVADGGKALMAIEELSRIALERCKTARCAVTTMGGLGEQYGFYGSDPGLGGSAEAMIVGDQEEVWVFHILPHPVNGSTAVWISQRVPDDEMVVVANMFVIRHIDLDDPEWFLGSANVKSAALEQGWWDGEKEFDFTAAYAYNQLSPLLHKNDYYSGRRIWRIFDWVAPSLHLDSTLGHVPEKPTYPFSVKPDERVEENTLMMIMKDHYEGTEYDLTKGLAAGPFGNPNRYAGGRGENVVFPYGGWERAISMYRTTYSFIGVIRDAPVTGHYIWYGQDAPHGTCYVPVYANQNSVPAAWYTGVQSEFSRDSAWWAFNFVNQWTTLKYSYIIKDVQAAAFAWQAKGFELIKEIDGLSNMAVSDADALVLYAEKKANSFSSELLDSWWKLSDFLISKYYNGYITEGEGERQAVGYPAWWLESVGTYVNYPNGDVEPKPCKPDGKPVGGFRKIDFL